MEAMYTVTGIVFFIIAAVFVIGWIVPLIIGIVQMRRGSRTMGIALLASSGIWALMGIGILAFTIVGFKMLEGRFDTTDFDPAVYEGEMGNLVIPYKEEADLVVYYKDVDKRYNLKVKDGVTQVPVGAPRIERFSVHVHTEDDECWRGGASYGRDKQVIIEPNAETQVELGPPFTAAIEVSRGDAHRVTLKPKVTDVAGGSAHLSGKEDITCVAVSTSGEILWEGGFDPG